MELQITKLYKNENEEVVGFEWKNPETNSVGRSLSAEFIEWAEKKGGKAYVSTTSDGRVYLSVRVLPNGDRTFQPSRNGVWTSELDSLQTLAI